MDPELKKLLEENLRVANDTNALLRSMNRQAWYGYFIKVVVWVVLIGLSLYFSMMLIGPYLDLLQGTENGESGYNIDDLQKLLEQYKVE